MSLSLVGLMGISSSSFFSSWFLLESSTLIFLFSLMTAPQNRHRAEVLSFFYTQALSGMMFFCLYLLASNWGAVYFMELTFFTLLFKMGAFPFHNWFLSLSDSLDWANLWVWLTLLKLIPLHLMSAISSSFLWIMSLMTWLMAMLFSWSVSNLKKVIIFSSLYFMGIFMILIFYSTMSWIYYWAMYSLMLAPVFYVITNQGEVVGVNKWKIVGALSGLHIWLLMLNLAGFPPFPGFWLKMSVLLSVKFDYLSAATMLGSSVFMIYMYINFSLRSVMGVGGKSLYMKLNQVSVSVWLFLLLTTAVSALVF